MGAKYAIDGFLKCYNWDYVTRAVKINSVPGQIKVHEFDDKGINEIIYDQNDVVIRTIPAIHAGDGPVSFIIEWKGYKIVYVGDMMVWNITKDGVRERMAVSDDNAWDVAGPPRPPAPDKKFPPQESKFTLDGRWPDAVEIEQKAFKEFHKKHGLGRDASRF